MQKSCSICLEENAHHGIFFTTVCNHTFHVRCINKWLRTNNTCPDCRLENPDKFPNYKNPQNNERLVLPDIVTPVQQVENVVDRIPRVRFQDIVTESNRDASRYRGRARATRINKVGLFANFRIPRLI
jgi:hypothetical protein